MRVSFARGLATLSDVVDLEYFVTGQYNGASESGIAWNGPDLGIGWPHKDPSTSARDESAQTLDQWLARPDLLILPIACVA